MKKEHYFEGWYFKCSTASDTIAVIVGCAKGDQALAFIQVFMTGSLKSYYMTYDSKAYRYTESPFRVQIEENIFTDHYIKLNICEQDLRIEGSIKFESLTRLPQKFWKRGLMGPFAYLPFMECYHDILSMSHKLKGTLKVNGIVHDFESGKGYIERDWGTSFPSSYRWMQCNHFQQKSLSFMLAIAHIPFLGQSFTGFLCCISIQGHIRIFTTYTGAKIKQFHETNKELMIEIKQGKESIHVCISNKEGAMLKAPNKGTMQRVIYETLESTMELSLFYEDVLKVHTIGKNVAFERVGEAHDLYS